MHLTTYKWFHFVVRLCAFVFAFLFVVVFSPPSESSYLPTTGSNVGIGTSTPVGGLVVMNGNVGVGTWSPTSRVQIIGTVAATAFVGDGSGLTGITAGGWTDGGTNVYTSTITDNVGIGTTTPTVRLHVPWISGDTTTTAYFGALNMSDNQTAVVAQSGTGGGVFGESVTYIGVNGYSNSSSGIRGESASGYGVEGASDSSSSGFFRARLSGNATATLLTKQNGAGTADLFQAQNDAGTSLVNITSAGNMGIGTWIPAQRLQVIGTVNATAFVGDGSGLTNLPTSGGWTDGGTNIYQSTTTDLVAVGTTTPVSRLTVKGNVGIGTTTPYTTIAAPANGMIVEGNVGIGTFAAVNGKLIVMGGNVGIGDITPDGVLDFDLVSTSTTGGFQYGSYFTVDDSGVVTSGFDSTYGNYLVLSRSGATGGTIDTYGNFVYGSTIDQAGAGTANFYGNYVTLASGPDGADNNYGYYANFQPGQPSLTYGFYANNTTGPSAGGTTYGFYSSVTAQAAAATAYGLYVDAGTGSGTEYAAAFLNGNVGIGTFAPRGRLIVASGNVGIGTLDPVGALTVMNGNVGIGTWSPTARLQVVGSVMATSFVGDGSGLTGISANSGWTDGGTNVYTSTTTDNVGIGTTTPTAALLVENAGTQDSFRVNDAVADGTPFVIDASGNVGIGTTVPLVEFQVARNKNAGTAFAVSNTDAGAAAESSVLVGTDAGYLTFGIHGSGFSTPGLGYVWTTASSPLYFGTNATTRMVIDATGNIGIGTTDPVGAFTVMSGNVGIGTWSPTARLQVVGTVNATAFVGDGSGLTNLPASGGWTDGGTNVYTSTTTDLVAVGTTTPVSRLTVKGNVGIGTTTPYTTIAAPANGMIVEGNVGIGTFAAASGKLIVMGGNVGVGTLAPSFSIEVRGSGNAGGDLGAQYISTNSSGWANNRFVNNVGSDAWVGIGGAGTAAPYVSRAYLSSASGVSLNADSASADIRFYQGILGVHTEWARFNTSGNFGVGTTTPVAGLAVMNGNVGIGTWSPTARLQVVGSVMATSFVGDGSGLTGISAGSTGWTDGGTNVYTTTTTDNVGIGTTTPSTTLEIVKQSSNAPLMISHTAAGDGNILTVTSSGNVGIGTAFPVGGFVVMNGNVGIGTVSPEYPFMVSRDDDGAGNNPTPPEIILRKAFGQDWYKPNFIGQMSGGTIASPTDVIDGWNLVGIVGEGWANSAYLGFGQITIGVDGTPGFLDSPGAIRFYTTPDGDDDWLLRMTIRSNGSVGIGTTLSTDGLAILNGNVGIGTWSSPANRLSILGNVGIGTTLPYRRISAPNNGMVVEGNVGIGTWNPQAKLQVAGSVMATSFVGDGSGLTGISAGSTGWTDGGTNVYTSTTTDNVGIGTTTPAAPLHVRSAEAANASGQEVLRVAGNNGIAGSGPAVAFTDQFGNDIGEIRSYWEATAQAGMSFGVNGGQGQLHISGTGNVGIGSTAPNARLDLRQTLSSVTGGTSLYYGYLSFAPSAPTGGADQPYGILQDTWYSGVNDISSWETSSIKGRAFSSMDAAAELSTTAGVEGHGVQAGDGQIGDLYGVYGYAYKAGVGDVVRMTGVYGRAYNLNTTGSVLNLIGGNFSTVTDPNTTVTNATAVSGAVSAGVTTAMSTAKAVSASVTTSGTITDAYGLYVDTIQGSNKWAVYATDATTPSFFAGNVGVGTTAPVGGLSVMNGNVGIGTWSPRGALEVKGTGSAQITINGASGGCLMFRDTDNSGWTECNALNGVLTCSVDADGICDGS